MMLLSETLLERGSPGDFEEVEKLIDMFSGRHYEQVPNARVFAAQWRAMLARVRRDPGYPELRRRYLDLAVERGFEGHRLWAEALPETLSGS